ncbi:MAG: hypothetical protein MUC36_07780 [Planctomycetes bacterium]|nr:hypothetical protein [Planctomycetota bacterium]
MTVCLFAAIVLTACADERSAPPAPAAPSAAVAALVLAAEPAGAIAVAAAKQRGPADSIVVTGRVANIVKGYAVFTLMDLAIPYCGETNKEDHCKTPWDYCCESTETRTKNALLVEARSADGKPLATPALGLQLVDRVAVTGKLTKDEHGNFVLLASGWFRQERPQLPDYVRWPQ